MHRIFLYLLLPAWLCLSVSYAQFNSFPPGVFSNKASRDPAPSGGGAVTLDVNQTGNRYQGSSGSTSFWNSSNGLATGGTDLMTVTAGNALVCSLVRGDAMNDVAAGVALTWDTGGTGGTPQSLSLIVSHTEFTNSDSSQLWGLVNPHTGNLKLRVQATNTAADNFIGCVSFSGVNVSTPFPNVNNTTTTSNMSLTCTSGTGHQVVGSMNNQGNGATLLGTTIYQDSFSGSVINASSDFIGGATPTIGSDKSTIIIVCADVSP